MAESTKTQASSGTDVVTSNSTPAGLRTTGADGGQGRTSIADSVVQKIAGTATREISGVHNLGTGSARAYGAIRQSMPGSGGPAAAQGVSVEVGETQTAIDLDIVVDYGVSIAQLAANIRRNVITAVERMTGLEVIEVNIAVDDIYIPGEDAEPEQARVE
jgi:uncharacterized alkaline shock family protein YloU